MFVPMFLVWIISTFGGNVDTDRCQFTTYTIGQWQVAGYYCPAAPPIRSRH